MIEKSTLQNQNTASFIYLFIYSSTFLGRFSGQLLYFYFIYLFYDNYFCILAGGGEEVERDGSLSILHRETKKKKTNKTNTNRVKQ